MVLIQLRMSIQCQQFLHLKGCQPNLIVNIPDVALNITSILLPNVTTTLHCPLPEPIAATIHTHNLSICFRNCILIEGWSSQKVTFVNNVLWHCQTTHSRRETICQPNWFHSISAFSTVKNYHRLSPFYKCNALALNPKNLQTLQAQMIWGYHLDN